MTGIKTNLPSELSSFVGRQPAIQELVRRLPTTRLLTLTGAGGVGKTRLALRVAAAALESYPDGVWLVELAPLTDPALVPEAVAAVLAPRERPGTSPEQRLIARLRARHLLIVLDNCEHVGSAAADLVGTLLHACAGVQVLATSQRPLGVADELVWRVPSLSLPARGQALSPDGLASFEAVRLFVERTTATQVDFVLGERNAQAVVEICRRLDGIPLALELAAACVRPLGVEETLARLSNRFQLLTRGYRTAPSRQRTIGATIDWSYGLLAPVERALLDRLAVFAGGCTAEAVETVCASAEVRVAEVRRGLQTLVAKSLVVADVDSAGDARYRLLESVRAYAWQRIDERGETVDIRRRHAEFFSELALTAEPSLRGTEQVAWLQRLEGEHDNLRLALAWALEADVELGVRLAVALRRFWLVRGHLGEGSVWLDRLLSRATPTIDASARAAALNAAGILASRRGDTAAAETWLRRSLALQAQLRDDAGVTVTLYELAKVLTVRGEADAARLLAEQALARWRAAGDRWGTAVGLNLLGELLREQGDLHGAAQFYAESLSEYEIAGDQRGLAIVTHNLGIVATEQGDFSRAVELHRSILPLKLELGYREGVVCSLINLARLAQLQGDMERAVRWCGAAEAERETIGAVLPPYERAAFAQTVDLARTTLRRGAFAALWAAGRAIPLDLAIGEAMTPRTARALADPSVEVAVVLTPREREVAALLAQGLTNREIGERLAITRPTADRHVSNIFVKLRMTTRAQVAAWVADHQTHM